MPDGLSPQDIQDLQQITTHLPAGHPMQAKISTLLNSQPTQFEKDRDPKNQQGTGATAVSDFIPSGGFSPYPMMDLDAKQAAAQGIAAADKNRKEMGHGVPYRTLAAIASPIANVSGMEEEADKGNAAGVLGHAAAGAATAATPLAAEGIGRGLHAAGEGISGAKDSIGSALREPTGELKPAVKDVARLGGTGIGASMGGGAGAIAGSIAGPSLADFLTPEHPNPTGPFSKVPNKMPKIAPPVENPFPGATSSAENLKGNPTPYSQLPPVPEGPQTKIPVVQKSGSPASLGKSTILDPNNLPPDEVTHQSVPWPELKKQAMGGNKFAIDEVIRRGREAEIPGLAGAVGRQKPYPRIGR